MVVPSIATLHANARLLSADKLDHEPRATDETLWSAKAVDQPENETMQYNSSFANTSDREQLSLYAHT